MANETEMSERRSATLVKRHRLGILAKLEHWLELPMIILGVLWLVLLVIDFATAWGPTIQPLTDAIWVIFIVDFVVKLVIAPDKSRYLRKNWLTAIALGVPALRIFRIARALRVLRLARTARGLRLVRVVTSVNRSMNAFGRIMRRRGLAYILILTLIVTFAGAAGMYTFEKGTVFESYGTALWWTAMLVTTMGSDAWPKSVEGRTLCLLLAIYAFSVFGYVTAALASFFVDRDKNENGPPAGERSLADLHQEIVALRQQIESLNFQNRGTPGGS